MKFFHFLAKKISYTFAVVFLTIPGGWMGAVFGYYLASSFLLTDYELISSAIIKWLPLAVFIPTFLHYVEFGLFTPIKIPAFFRPFRLINNNFYGNRLNPNISNEDLQDLYRGFSDLPLTNALSAGFFAALVGLCEIVLIFMDFHNRGLVTYQRIQIGAKMVSIAVIIVVILYTMSTYLLTEMLTNRDRASCYNELRKRGIDQKPRVLFNLRIKFSFFIILMVISLLTFAALVQKSLFYNQSDLTTIVIYIVISILAAFFLMVINTNSILRILREMDRVALEISAGGDASFRLHSLEGEFSSIEYAVLEMNKEIDGHRKNLETMVEQRTNELQNVLADLKERDELIQKQLDMASIIQRSILPGHIDEWLEVKFSVRYIAMEKIGGDFYDVYQLKDNKLGILVADVSGHGIPAALVTTMAKIAFGNACMKYDSPRRIFQDVNKNILEHVKTQDYLTAFFITIDDEYNITYANASHRKAILVHTEEGTVELLDTNGLFIGAIEEANDTYDEQAARMNYGDKLILYTDGIPEATNANREEYSNERFEELVLKNRHLPLEDFTSYIVEDVQRFIGNASVEDDITLVVIELARDEAVDIIRSAKKLVDQQKFYEAIEHLERGLSLYPGNTKILYNLSKYYFRVNNYGKTVEYIQKYVEKDKRNKFAYYIGGAAFYQMMDYKNAIEYLEQATKIDPNFTNAYFAAGLAYKKKGAEDDALRCFEKSLSLDPDNKYAQHEIYDLKKGQ